MSTHVLQIGDTVRLRPHLIDDYTPDMETQYGLGEGVGVIKQDHGHVVTVEWGAWLTFGTSDRVTHRPKGDLELIMLDGKIFHYS